MLMILLKRKETTDSSLSKSREQVEEYKGQLRPLTEEGHRLGLQKVCLEERFKLTQVQREDDIKQYKVMEMWLLLGSRQIGRKSPQWLGDVYSSKIDPDEVCLMQSFLRSLSPSDPSNILYFDRTLYQVLRRAAGRCRQSLKSRREKPKKQRSRKTSSPITFYFTGKH